MVYLTLSGTSRGADDGEPANTEVRAFSLSVEGGVLDDYGQNYALGERLWEAWGMRLTSRPHPFHGCSAAARPSLGAPADYGSCGTACCAVAVSSPHNASWLQSQFAEALGNRSKDFALQPTVEQPQTRGARLGGARKSLRLRAHPALQVLRRSAACSTRAFNTWRTPCTRPALQKRGCTFPSRVPGRAAV